MKFQKYPWTGPREQYTPTYHSPHNKRSTSLNGKCHYFAPTFAHFSPYVFSLKYEPHTTTILPSETYQSYSSRCRSFLTFYIIFLQNFMFHHVFDQQMKSIWVSHGTFINMTPYYGCAVYKILDIHAFIHTIHTYTTSVL